MIAETTSPETGLARLRAAASLIPVIESDFANSKLSPERAALLSEFCQWASESAAADCQESQRLSKLIQEGLIRLKAKIG